VLDPVEAVLGRQYTRLDYGRSADADLAQIVQLVGKKEAQKMVNEVASGLSMRVM
jgi:hypothetical protein